MLNANRLSTNIIVTCLVLVMVFVLPLIDRRVCARLGVNLHHGMSSNPNADALLQIRQMILFGVFAVYIAAYAYLVFFSRSASEAYLVHIAPFADLQNAIDTDYGLFDFIVAIFKEGVQQAFTHIRVVKFEDIAQAYMNVMLFVPMGYLLPYVFEFFRARSGIRPVLACFIISFITENLQLIFRRGFYDMDDLLANTLGGFIGQMLFIWVGYVVTHPDWRRELFTNRRWQKTARRSALYPFARRIDLSRTTLLGTDEEAVYHFYVTQLGFKPRRQLTAEYSFGTDFLFEMGKTQVEVRCSNRPAKLPTQYLSISARNLPLIKERLLKHDIVTGPFGQDPYTGQRQLSFTGPDGVIVTILEEEV